MFIKRDGSLESLEFFWLKLLVISVKQSLSSSVVYNPELTYPLVYKTSQNLRGQRFLNGVICPTNSSKTHKILNDKEKQQIVKSKKLEPVNITHFIKIIGNQYSCTARPRSAKVTYLGYGSQSVMFPDTHAKYFPSSPVFQHPSGPTG